ncbi:uncharacterized protein PADG_07935 [Paracoccidioides brasiliensis Pb18]|uniref:Uncharacterized protein n=1 Tax=Paracoccidioides brasiliensis (strain Pb18) TaxID=502780 RepID=C1GKS8_PARBD|nr:uncharacterized protein PADG_07935 [Paracoccidioides brasiliensis Pb18]EEH43115.2 hypothetical protein PADG_07935 [Paracoccidioides brasiliensis Pb18]
MRHVTGPMDLVLSPILHRTMMCAKWAGGQRKTRCWRAPPPSLLPPPLSRARGGWVPWCPGTGPLGGSDGKSWPVLLAVAALGTDCRDAPIDPKQNVGGQGFGTPLPVCSIPFAYLRRGVGRITKTGPDQQTGGNITHVGGREMSGHVL